MFRLRWLSLTLRRRGLASLARTAACREVDVLHARIMLILSAVTGNQRASGQDVSGTVIRPIGLAHLHMMQCLGGATQVHVHGRKNILRPQFHY